MATQALVTEKRYEGKYVALESFTNNRVVSSGKNPARVLSAAAKKGVAHPVLVFVPRGDIAHIY